MLCKFANIFGAPGTGVHSIRLFGVAVVDVLVTVLFAYLISKWKKISFVKTLIILFVLGIVLHRLFCVRTTIDKILFPSGV